MKSMETLYVTLLTLGVMLLLVGIIGQVKAKELDVGTKNPLARIIIGLIGLFFIGLSLYQSFFIPPSPSTPTPGATIAPVVNITPTQPQSPKNLHISNITAYPVTVMVGEKSAIYVTVEDDENHMVQGASVLVEAGGGKFLQSETTSFDPNSNLQGPFSAAGLTEMNGVFTTWWVCNPCAPAYGLNIKVTKPGYIDAPTAEFTIQVK
jgi:hypothetical protein